MLVIFVIRTCNSPFKSRPHIALLMASLVVVLIAGLLPFMPFAAHLGFVAPPLLFYLIMPLMVLCYLLSVGMAKRFFYRYYAG